MQWKNPWKNSLRANCAIAAFVCGLMVGVATGQNVETLRFDINGQDLASALNEFAIGANFEILYAPELVKDKQSVNVNGNYSAVEALEHLLEGSGLTYEFTDANILLIRARADETGYLKSTNSSPQLAMVQETPDSAQPNSAEQDIPSSDTTAEAGEGGRDGGITNVIEEIIVTARKREELIQDIPWSIRALSERELEQLGADDFLDYARTVAGLSFISFGPGFTKIVIRGVSEGRSTRNQATTGIYIDETPVTRNGINPDLRLFDVQRVEVLRGPQGTLYGSASMGGTIKVVTNKPDAGAFASKIDASYSGTRHGDGNAKVNAMVNIPVIDGKVAFRAVGYYRDTGGFIDSPDLGLNNVNDEEIWGARLAARFDVNEALTVTVSFMIQNSNIGPPPEDDLNFDPVSGEFVDIPDLKQSRLVENVQDDDQQIYNLTINYDFGWAELVSSTSYFKRSFFQMQDISDAFGVPLTIDSDDPNKDFIQETRLASTGDSRFAWLAGVFYSDRNKNGSTAFASKDTLEGILPPFLLGDALLDATLGGGNEQLALFGEVSFDITNSFQMTVGLRWFDVKTDFQVFATGLFAGAPPGAPPLIEDLKSSESSVNPKFLLSYRVSGDALLYAQAAQGFRIGGTNQVSTVSGACGPELAELGLSEPPSTFDSDSLWNYELGAKTSWLDNRLILNGAIYYIDWSDVQVSRVLFSCGFAFTDNAGRATSKGFELEMRALPMAGLELTGSLSFSDVEIGGDPGILASLGAVNGEAMPGVPKWTFSFSVEVNIPLASGLVGLVRGDYQYVDSSPSDFSLTGPMEVGGYHLGNIRVGVSGDGWQVSVFVNNVWDERASLAAIAQGGRPFVVRNRPRTVGVNVRKTF